MSDDLQEKPSVSKPSVPDPNARPTIDSTSSKLIAWARLMRIANVPTAWTNVLVAFLFAHGSWSPTVELLLLLLATSCLFCGGMVLNDVFDFKVDQVQRPTRPIPAGLISLPAARSVAICLMLFGVVSATAAGTMAYRAAATDLSGGVSLISRSLGCSLALALSIWLYDGPLKKTWLAPIAMGACRFFNILLGASTLSSGVPQDNVWLGFPLIVVVWAAAVGVLIAGVTLLAKDEVSLDSQKQPQLKLRLAVAGSLVTGGLVGIASLTWLFPELAVQPKVQIWFPAFVALISWRIVRDVFHAFASPSPYSIKRGVISVLQSLIILDAVVSCLAVPNSIPYSLAVLAMLLPVLWLGKRIPIT